MVSLAGLSAAAPGFISGLNDQRGIMQDRERQAVLAALGQAYPQLFQQMQMPGAQPMPQQAPQGTNVPMSPGMAGRFNDAFGGPQSPQQQAPRSTGAPMDISGGGQGGAGLNLPATDGLRPGSLTWPDVVQAIQQRNPGIPPAILAQAVQGFVPFMDAQNQEKWKAISEERLSRTADNSAAAKSAVRPLTRLAINDLSAAGEGFTNFNRLTSTWNDRYSGKAGWTGATGGNIANWWARQTGQGDTEAANWWQDYQNQSNIVRHALFGSALTATEKAQWDAAAINPGMDPAIARQNLTRQYQAAQRAASKLANVYRQQGATDADIEAALGVPIDSLGLAPATAAAPETGGGDQPMGAGAPEPGDVVDGYTFKGGDPADPASWEQVQ